jgi:predicted ATPase
LRRLGTQDSLSIVQSAVQGMRMGADLVNVVLERAEGNPFFLEELARAIGEGDEVRVDTVVPETVQGVLMARIDRLPEAPRRVLQYASVLGREFSVRPLNAIWDAPGPLGPHMEVLRRQEFVYEQPAANEPSYVFKHALTQDVAYESLLASRRKALHAAAGSALERLYAGRLDEVYDRLAHHYGQTDDAVRAVEYLTLFAEKAARVYANTDAARALEQAIDHVSRLPTEERDRREIELVLRLSHSYYFLGRVPATLDLLLGHRERVERLQDPRLTGQFYFWLAHTHTYLSDLDGARTSARRAIEAASSCGD